MSEWEYEQKPPAFEIVRVLLNGKANNQISGYVDKNGCWFSGNGASNLDGFIVAWCREMEIN